MVENHVHPFLAFLHFCSRGATVVTHVPSEKRQSRQIKVWEATETVVRNKWRVRTGTLMCWQRPEKLYQSWAEYILRTGQREAMSRRGHSEMEHQEKVDSWQKGFELNPIFLSYAMKSTAKMCCGKRKKGTRTRPGGTPISQPDIISETPPPLPPTWRLPATEPAGKRKLTSSVSKLSADCGFLIRLSSFCSRLSSLLSAPNMIPAQPVRPKWHQNSPRKIWEQTDKTAARLVFLILLFDYIIISAPWHRRTALLRSAPHVSSSVKCGSHLFIIHPQNKTRQNSSRWPMCDEENRLEPNTRSRGPGGGAPHFPGEARLLSGRRRIWTDHNVSELRQRHGAASSNERDFRLDLSH